jgi:hypothetical protein
MHQFYQTFPIRHTLRAELTWSHYRMLMCVEEPNRHEFYLTESANERWMSRQLERQINSFFYERLLATQKENRPEITGEVYKLEPKTDADYILKDPYILEFLENGDRLFRNTETNGRSPSDWCSIIYQRLGCWRGICFGMMMVRGNGMISAYNAPKSL